MAIAGIFAVIFVLANVFCATNTLLICFFVRINTFRNKVLIDEGLYHPVHEYCDTLKNIYLDDFLHSPQYNEFKERTGRNTISFTLFKKGAKMCPCIKEPQMRVCVDEVETVFNHLATTLSNIGRRRRDNNDCDCEFCTSEANKKERLKEGE
jgi:hypothetical protein